MTAGADILDVDLGRVLRTTRNVARVYLSANDDAALYAAHDACPEVLITTTYRDLDQMADAVPDDPEWCAPSPIGQPPTATAASTPTAS